MKARRRSKSLSTKIVFTIIMFVMVCSMIWGIAFTRQMMDSFAESMIKDEQARLERVTQEINRTREVCNFATEIVKQSTRLTDYLESIHKGEEMEIEEKLELYHREIAAIENMSNANPYLYQVRIYANSEIVTEKAPSLYDYDRLSNLSWSGDYESGEWKLDYTDTTFPDYVAIQTPHLAGLLYVEKDIEGKELYLIECVTYMSSLFPELYEDSTTAWSAFLVMTAAAIM